MRFPLTTSQRRGSGDGSCGCGSHGPCLLISWGITSERCGSGGGSCGRASSSFLLPVHVAGEAADSADALLHGSLLLDLSGDHQCVLRLRRRILRLRRMRVISVSSQAQVPWRVRRRILRMRFFMVCSRRSVALSLPRAVAGEAADPADALLHDVPSLSGTHRAILQVGTRAAHPRFYVFRAISLEVPRRSPGHGLTGGPHRFAPASRCPTRGGRSRRAAGETLGSEKPLSGRPSRQVWGMFRTPGPPHLGRQPAPDRGRSG